MLYWRVLCRQHRLHVDAVGTQHRLRALTKREETGSGTLASYFIFQDDTDNDSEHGKSKVQCSQYRTTPIYSLWTAEFKYSPHATIVFLC